MLQGWRPSKNKDLKVGFCTKLVSLKSNFDQRTQRRNDERTETESENLLIGRDQRYAAAQDLSPRKDAVLIYTVCHDM